MQRKIFIGISVSKNVQKRLIDKIQKWKDLPVRWSAEENLHVTLSFLGYVDDEILSDVCDRVENVTAEIDAFDISLSQIELGPEKGEGAKVVWFTGEANEELKKLSEVIDSSLGISDKPKKEFRPHVTLGRIKQFGWKNLPEIPQIEEKFLVSIPVENVEIFESAVVNGKRKFISIGSYPLNY